MVDHEDSEDRLPPAGLCADCRWAELLRSRTSVFLRCGLSDRDPHFPRYPSLPVTCCAGHRRRAEESS